MGNEIMTFAEFRRSRLISQSECAMLLSVGRQWVREREPKPLGRFLAEAIDEQLKCGSHSFIKPRYYWPDGTAHMPATIRRRLPLGACYLSLEYFEPDTLEIAQSRKDLLAIAKEHPAERLFILRRIIRRGTAGVQVIDVKVPHWPQPTFDK